MLHGEALLPWLESFGFACAEKMRRTDCTG